MTSSTAASTLSGRIKRLARWGLLGLTSLVFVASGAGKLAASTRLVEGFLAWGYPLWFMYAVGAAEVIGGVLLLMPERRVLGAPLLFWGSATLGLIMAGAVGTHLMHSEYGALALPAALLGLVLWLGHSSRPEHLPWGA